MRFSPAGTFQGTPANRTVAAAMILALVVGAACPRPAVAQNNWLGTTDSDYFTGSNWSTGSAPTFNQQVEIGGVPYTNAPVFNGDNTGTQTAIFNVFGNNNGTFTMAGGSLLIGGQFNLGNSSTPGMATFNMNGGSARVTADFRTSHTTGALATFNMNAGTFEVVSGNANNEVWFANPGGGDRPNTVTTLVVTGGTFTSNGRLTFGASNSNNLAIANAHVNFTMTGGLMWAKGAGSGGTVTLQGGRHVHSGGIIKGSDISLRDGWNKVSYGGTGGTDFRGGVIQIDTNQTEGSVFVVPQGVDPTTVVGTPLQRGQSRMIFSTAPVYGPAGNTGPRFYSTLPDSTVRVWMDTSGSVQQANAFASPRGDYNLDGVVNRGDFLLWQSQQGNTYLADPLSPETTKIGFYGADGNGDGVVTQADFDVWAGSIGQRAVGGPYAWAQARTIDVASGSQTQAEAGAATLTFTTASSVTKIGAGTLVMNVANTYTGTTNVNAGTVQVVNPLALQSSPVTVQSGGKLTLPADARIVVPVENLSVDQGAGGGSVDVGVGEIDAFRGINATELRAELIAGHNGGGWNGATGISSSAAAASGGARAVGYVVNSDGGARVSFAAPGDVDLNGEVDLLDLLAIAGSGTYQAPVPSVWSQGDFNYDGVTDLLDLLAVLSSNTYDRGPYLPAGPVTPSLSAVPEPSMAAWIGVAVACAAGWRRRAGTRRPT